MAYTINNTLSTNSLFEFNQNPELAESETEQSKQLEIRVPDRLQATPKSRQSSPSRFSNNTDGFRSGFGFKWLGFLWEEKHQPKRSSGKRKGGRVWYKRKGVKRVVALISIVVMFFLVNYFMLMRLQDDPVRFQNGSTEKSSPVKASVRVQGETKKPGKVKKKGVERMLAMAAHALAEAQNKREPKDLWVEPVVPASAWRPCANQDTFEPNEGNNGYIMVTANGGINQQRVAVCNIVVVARLLNATLVIPKFLYSDVWNDTSQFGDIYQEEHFISYMTPDVRIVKDLPKELQSLDLDAIGSTVSDADIAKESKPSFYLKYILPILLKNKVVHFLGFGNRLAFDPISFQLQRLRCRCNFHALRFVPKLQEAGALLVKRLRQNASQPGPSDHYLVGQYAESILKDHRDHIVKPSKYLALHLRFEIDMVAHSMCYYGGGEEEKRELEAYRQIHFPSLVLLKNEKKFPPARVLRSEGLCPLTPEETVLMLAALGFNRKTRIFIAGANIYGGRPRLAALTTLYPNLVTKENLLSSTELQPFKNFSSQLAALDFIGCTAADAFAMTDSGSQFSSLVSGYRIYYGGGKMATIRPNKRRLADIFLKNNTIEWKVFEQRVRKAVRQTKHVHSRPAGRSVYRFPRCKECMCNANE